MKPEGQSFRQVDLIKNKLLMQDMHYVASTPEQVLQVSWHGSKQTFPLKVYFPGQDVQFFSD